MSIIQGTTKVSAGGYNIDQSIRFNRSDSAYLTRTFSTDEGDTWTFSLWLKRGQLSTGNNQYFFSEESGASGMAFVTSTDTLRLYNGATVYNSTPVYRDTSGWYHIVFSSNAGTWVCYVNGEQVSGFTGTATLFNRNNQWNICRHVSNSNHFDGYLAEIYWIGDQALAPTDFGETNDDGVWIAKRFAGAYGSNGFHLTGEDSADLGADYSGNGNDFTSSGLTTSSQVTDTPTDNYCVLNDLVQNRDSNQTNSDGIRAASLQLYRPSASANSFGSGTMAVYGGVGSPKLYYEIYTTSYPGGNALSMYIEEATDSSNSQPTNSFGLNQRHTTSPYRLFIYPGGSETPTSWTSEFGQGVYVGLAVDFANDVISANVDGTEIFSYDAAELAALSGITTDTFAGRWWRPKIQVGNDQPTTIDVNFGQNAFQNAPTGYVGWSTSAIPTPTIKDGSAHFNTILYTGDGSATTRSLTGVGFQPDFVWKKVRSAADNHWLHDAVRGADKGLNTNRTDSEYTSTRLTSFDSDGFSFATNDPDTNGSGRTYVAWNWLAGNGTASNTDGDFTSTVSANQTAGFSVVTWTGDGTSTVVNSIGHGLGKAPSLIIMRRRSPADDWFVYAEPITQSYYLRLNSIAAQTIDTGNNTWGGTAPTSSVFYTEAIGSAAYDYVAYCFAEVEGFSKFGKYIGNGSADGPFVWCGFRPAFVLVKRTNSADNWVIVDSSRNSYNVANLRIYPDTTNADITSTTHDFLSNGFKLRASDGGVNGSASTYIFMAFAEHPFGGSAVAPVPAR